MKTKQAPVGNKEKAKALVQSFEQFLEEHRDEYEALRVFYSQPYQERLQFSVNFRKYLHIQVVGRTDIPLRTCGKEQYVEHLGCRCFGRRRE